MFGRDDKFPLSEAGLQGNPEDAEFIPLMTSDDEEEMNQEELPDILPILPLRNTVLFPGVVIPITAGRDKSIKLLNDAQKSDSLVGILAQRNADDEDPDPESLYSVGTLAKILRMFKMPDGNTTVILQGEEALPHRTGHRCRTLHARYGPWIARAKTQAKHRPIQGPHRFDQGCGSAHHQRVPKYPNRGHDRGKEYRESHLSGEFHFVQYESGRAGQAAIARGERSGQAGQFGPEASQ
jgi:hypothetical protein